MNRKKLICLMLMQITFMLPKALGAVRLPFVFLKQPASNLAIIRLVIKAGSASDMHYYGLANLATKALMSSDAMQQAKKK